MTNPSGEQTENTTNINADTDTETSTKTEKKLAKVSGVKLKRKKKNKVKITWKSVKGATGYQIYVSTNKGKKYKKVKTISAKKKRSYTYTGKKGKTVYVKIRAYKKTNGKTTYGTFSKVKKIKVK